MTDEIRASIPKLYCRKWNCSDQNSWIECLEPPCCSQNTVLFSFWLCSSLHEQDGDWVRLSAFGNHLLTSCHHPNTQAITHLQHTLYVGDVHQPVGHPGEVLSVSIYPWSTSASQSYNSQLQPLLPSLIKFSPWNFRKKWWRWGCMRVHGVWTAPSDCSGQICVKQKSPSNGTICIRTRYEMSPGSMGAEIN